jgi:uncharacterized membrane protein YjjP (DUF1212 family)
MSLQERSDLVLKFAEVLHDNGQTTGETIGATERLGKGLGLNTEIIPGWREIYLQSADGKKRLLSVASASPTGVNMDRVSSAMQVIEKVSAKRITFTGLEKSIITISRAPSVSTWLFTLAAAGGAVALSVIFGVHHVASVLLIAFSAGAGALIRRGLAKYSSNPFLQPFCAALLAGIIGAVAVLYNLSSSLRLIAVVPCLVLVPGPHLLNGMIDLIRARISLAVSRLVYAGFIILVISSGLLLTLTLLNVSLPVEASGRTVAIWADVLAAGIAAAAYAIFYSTPPRMIGWPIALGMLAHALRYETLAAGGNVITAAFVASLFVGLVVTPIARRCHMPFAAIGFASVVSMIPGVYLFRLASGVLQLANGSSTTLQLLGGIAYDGATAMGIILAISFGVIVPKIVIDHFMKY